MERGGQLDDDDDVEVDQVNEVEGNEEVCEGGVVVNEKDSSDDHDNYISEDEYRSIISDSDDSVSDYEGGGDFVAVDEENQHIKVYALFANVKQYRIALKQWCIKEEFVVVYEKNELKRVTARVWDGREKAIRQIYGDPKDSFLLVPKLQEEIKKSNPGSIVHYVFSEKLDLPYQVNPPIFKRGRCRPKKKRIRDPNEKKRKKLHRCGKCHQYGLHKNKCSMKGKEEATGRRGNRGTGSSTAATK
ncbi:hypothetical protein QJS10_CPA03g00581 [Acorus calamus]|uniref:Uncharacterized protein n=1 Tax=Acorus calamus TaxID=4465 RepID=A0AAV9F9B8_ACOCL|nr:hypothetical protein QJS10_CPA03g00581 [Acorus calamus]